MTESLNHDNPTSGTVSPTRWLRERFGFTRGNPFGSFTADKERDLLPEFFVDVEGYDQIKDGNSTMVFAALGGGKSALRIALAANLAPLNPYSSDLAVEYTDFSGLGERELPSLADHIGQLLHKGIEAVMLYLVGPLHTGPIEDLYRARVSEVPSHVKALLGAFIHTHYPDLLHPLSLSPRLQHANSVFQPRWNLFEGAVAKRALRDFLADYPQLLQDPIALFWAELVDESPTILTQTRTPLESMRQFVILLRALKLERVYFLVDRLDEMRHTSRNAEAQVDFIENLLTGLDLLEMPHVAFKFFLTRETRDAVIIRPTIRLDRLRDQMVTVEWTDHRLRLLLRARLAVYSGRAIQEFSQLCEEGVITLRGKGEAQPQALWLEQQLLKESNGSPRWLLMALEEMCRAHINRLTQEPKILQQGLDSTDWEFALREMKRRLPHEVNQFAHPTLTIYPHQRIVKVRGQHLKLQHKLFELLLKLAEVAPDVCSRDILGTLWDDYVTDETLDQTIRRLRAALEEDPKNPIYVTTVRGRGYQLHHSEIQS
jgi:hypothetical protein